MRGIQAGKMRCRRRLVGAAVALAALAGGQPSVAAAADGVTSPNVEHVRHIPIDGGATSAAVVGKRLYVAGWSTLAIFDISEPADPIPLSEVSLGLQFPHEDVDTNGKILVLAETQLTGPSPFDRFHIWDVTDPANPREIASPPNPRGDRSLTCVYNCTYAYGSAGTILDLTNPANPQVVGNWLPAGTRAGFDVTEARPGIILASTRPLLLFDARDDPRAPRLVASGEDTQRVAHFAQWPHNGNDRFMLTSVETFGKPRCDSGSGPLITWDAASAETGTLRIIDELRWANGTITDGLPLVNKVACSTHVFDAHPDFRNGGLVAVGHFDHGTRFVDVAPNGQMTEIGYFMPFSGQTFAARWANDEVVYGVDLERGIDVLRLR